MVVGRVVTMVRVRRVVVVTVVMTTAQVYIDHGLVVPVVAMMVPTMVMATMVMATMMMVAMMMMVVSKQMMPFHVSKGKLYVSVREGIVMDYK